LNENIMGPEHTDNLENATLVVSSVLAATGWITAYAGFRHPSLIKKAEASIERGLRKFRRLFKPARNLRYFRDKMLPMVAGLVAPWFILNCMGFGMWQERSPFGTRLLDQPVFQYYVKYIAGILFIVIGFLIMMFGLIAAVLALLHLALVSTCYLLIAGKAAGRARCVTMLGCVLGTVGLLACLRELDGEWMAVLMGLILAIVFVAECTAWRSSGRWRRTRIVLEQAHASLALFLLLLATATVTSALGLFTVINMWSISTHHNEEIDWGDPLVKQPTVPVAGGHTTIRRIAFGVLKSSLWSLKLDSAAGLAEGGHPGFGVQWDAVREPITLALHLEKVDASGIAETIEQEGAPIKMQSFDGRLGSAVIFFPLDQDETAGADRVRVTLLDKYYNFLARGEVAIVRPKSGPSQTVVFTPYSPATSKNRE
jgi:hypothetical protein